MRRNLITAGGIAALVLALAIVFAGSRLEATDNSQVGHFICGDCNGDGAVDMGDLPYLVKYVFANGEAPRPLQAGDVNCDSAVDVGDVTYLARYLAGKGPKPCANCPTVDSGTADEKR